MNDIAEAARRDVARTRYRLALSLGIAQSREDLAIVLRDTPRLARQDAALTRPVSLTMRRGRYND
jgi:hypothetical protein